MTSGEGEGPRADSKQHGRHNKLKREWGLSGRGAWRASLMCMPGAQAFWCTNPAGLLAALMLLQPRCCYVALLVFPLQRGQI